MLPNLNLLENTSLQLLPKIMQII